MLISVEFNGLRLYSSALVDTQSSGSLWGSVPFGEGALFKPVLAQHYEYLHSGCNVKAANIFGTNQWPHVHH